jgi:hypothetical protein
LDKSVQNLGRLKIDRGCASSRLPCPRRGDSLSAYYVIS